MAVWQSVHARYFTAWLWNEGIAGAPGSTAKEWHSRQSRYTWLRLSRRGFEEPCGVWQAEQPSIFTTGCSKTKGPALSVWHLKQTVSPVDVVRSWRASNPPCGLWQSTHFTRPSLTRWWKGRAKCCLTSRWQEKQ